MDTSGPARKTKDRSQASSPGGSLRSNVDLILVLLWTSITLLFVFVPPLAYSIARLMIGLLFLIIVPSYALTAAIFTQRNSISSFERVMLMLGLSFPIVSLICLGLDFSGLGMQLSSIAASTSIFTAFCTAAAFLRRQSLPPEERFFVSFGHFVILKGAIFPKYEGRFDKMLSAILAISIVIAVSGLAFALASPKQGEKFTELYLLGSGGQAGNYTTEYRLGEQKPITVGITNHEYETKTYDLVIKLNDSTRSTTLYSERVTVANNETQQKQIEIRPDRLGTNMKLEFLLYADGSSVPSSEDHLWINVTR